MPRGWLQVARRDLGNLAIHWTKAAGGGDGFLEPAEPRREADAVLDQILAEAALRGGNGYIKGGHTCVCFTEAPLVEMVSVFASIAVARAARRAALSALWHRRPEGMAIPSGWASCNLPAGRRV